MVPPKVETAVTFCSQPDTQDSTRARMRCVQAAGNFERACVILFSCSQMHRGSGTSRLTKSFIENLHQRLRARPFPCPPSHRTAERRDVSIHLGGGDSPGPQTRAWSGTWRLGNCHRRTEQRHRRGKITLKYCGLRCSSKIIMLRQQHACYHARDA